MHSNRAPQQSGRRRRNYTIGHRDSRLSAHTDPQNLRIHIKTRNPLYHAVDKQYASLCNVKKQQTAAMQIHRTVMDSHATRKLMLCMTLNHKHVPSTSNTRMADSAERNTQEDRLSRKGQNDSASDSTQHADDTSKNMLHRADLACPPARPRTPTAPVQSNRAQQQSSGRRRNHNLTQRSQNLSACRPPKLKRKQKSALSCNRQAIRFIM